MRLPASAAGSRRKGRAGSILRLASARHGRPHAVERHLLRRDLDSRRGLSSAAGSADARPVQAGLCPGDRDWRAHGHPRHHRRPGQRRRQNVARLRVADASGRGVRGDRTRAGPGSPWPTSWDTPRFARCSSCARPPCFTTITRCTPPWVANSHRPAAQLEDLFPNAPSCGSIVGRSTADIWTRFWIAGWFIR